MTDYPEFWNKILQCLGLESFAGIENIANVLTFLGYTTAASISKLCKQKELNLFQIEVSKLSTNANFCARHPELQSWQLGHGTLEVLKDISKAAASCIMKSVDDVESVQKNVFERCIKVAPNLIQSNVMVNFDIKPSCEIICPFNSCRKVTKLGVLKQTNLFTPPNFNIFNFERHINTQHINKKRKIDEDPCILLKKTTSDTVLSLVSCDVSSVHENGNFQSFNSLSTISSSTPIHRKPSNEQPHLMTPKTANIFILKEKLAKANEKIHELETIHTSTSSSSLSLTITPKSAKIDKLSADLIAREKMASQLHTENILLRHKCMDTRGKIRTFCRIKPDETGDIFKWQSNDTNIQISSDNYSMDYIFHPQNTNKDVFNMIKPLLISALEGYNICIIAYGASGSGKSHTMTETELDLGIIPRSIEYLLQAMPGHYEFIANCFEIYNETFIDLLMDKKTIQNKPITISNGQLVNCQSFEIDSTEKFNAILKEVIQRRQVSATERNTSSSRSHAVFRIELKGKYKNIQNQIINSNIIFFDLAGCENATDHFYDIKSNERQIEMKNINQSASNFRTVIESLKKGEVGDFRSSKLTHVLKPCLTQNTKTLILTTISQQTKHLSSSKESLLLAESAGHIQIKGLKKNLLRMP